MSGGNSVFKHGLGCGPNRAIRVPRDNRLVLNTPAYSVLVPNGTNMPKWGGNTPLAIKQYRHLNGTGRMGAL